MIASSLIALLVQVAPPSEAEIAKGRQAYLERATAVTALLDAMRSGDRGAFRSLGGAEILFSSQASHSVSKGARALDLHALDELRSCTADRPRLTGIDWFSVIWKCPEGAAAEDTQYSFKFAGAKILAVQKTFLPPRIVSVRTNG